MKAPHFLVAVLFATAGAALGQPPPGLPAGGPFDIERLAILLDLDAYQKNEVERVLQEQRDARIAAREQLAESGERPAPEELHAQREQSREALFSQLQNTLTELQITKLKILMEGPQGPRGPRGARGTGTPPAAQF